MDAMEFCYRVREHSDGTWRIHVMFPPPQMGGPGWSKEYACFDDLPTLLKERVAVLQLCGEGVDEIKGVGRRYDSVPPTFWIYTETDVFT